MDIKKIILPEDKRRELPPDPLHLPFGRHFSDHMFSMKYKAGRGWFDPAITPYGPLSLDPAANVLHYSQEVFEGQKAYLSPDDKILLFRPRDNARRLNLSLRRMCMPELNEDDFLNAECELLKVEKRWIPRPKGSALYIRPAVIATEAAVGIRPADEYLFFIILSPVGSYFTGGFKPIPVWVSDTYIRAAQGGTGEAKTGGNYAGSLLATQQAKEKGYSQVVWLDAREKRYIEEMGGMNIFFVINGRLVTPALTGSILDGVTRKSIVRLAADLGLQVEERALTIEEVMAGIESGAVSEAFAAGTAAVITPIGLLAYKDKKAEISSESGTWTKKIFDALLALQYGEAPDPHGWVYQVD